MAGQLGQLVVAGAHVGRDGLGQPTVEDGQLRERDAALDGIAHELVGEAVAAGRLAGNAVAGAAGAVGATGAARGAGAVGLDEPGTLGLVDQLEHGEHRLLERRGQQPDREAAAGHRGHPHQLCARRGPGGEPPGDDVAEGRGQRRERPVRLQVAGQLADQQGVAVGEGEDPLDGLGAGRVAEHGPHRRPVESREDDGPAARAARQIGQGLREALDVIGRRRPVGNHDEHGLVDQGVHEVLEQPQRALIRSVRVVDADHEAPGPGGDLPDVGGDRGEPGEALRGRVALGGLLLAELAQDVGVTELPEHLAPRPERRRALPLRHPPERRRRPALPCRRERGIEQRGLADAGLAADEDDAGDPPRASTNQPRTASNSRSRPTNAACTRGTVPAARPDDGDDE